MSESDFQNLDIIIDLIDAIHKTKNYEELIKVIKIEFKKLFFLKLGNCKKKKLKIILSKSLANKRIVMYTQKTIIFLNTGLSTLFFNIFFAL